MRKLVSAILLLAGSCFAQVPFSPGNPPANQPASNVNALKGEISGQVLDSATGQPLKKAWVTARQAERGGRNGATAVTDQEGHFRLKDLDAGRFILSAQRNGYVSQSYGQKTPATRERRSPSMPDRRLPISLFA